MLRTVLAGALASGALLASGGAQAQGYGYGGYGVGVGAGVGFGGYDGGAPPYAGGGYGYAPYRPHGFTLAGVRAGVTVLGVDLDGSAKLTIGAHDWGRGGYAPTPYYPPQPQPQYQPVYQPASPPPGYWMGYSAPNCACAPPPPPCCGY